MQMESDDSDSVCPYDPAKVRPCANYQIPNDNDNELSALNNRIVLVQMEIQILRYQLRMIRNENMRRYYWRPPRRIASNHRKWCK